MSQKIGTNKGPLSHKGERKQRGFFQRSWWVFAVVALCFLIYSQAAYKKDMVIGALQHQLDTLLIEKAALLDRHEDLLLQVNSQSDPAWIELTLKKGLGLVPEGQRKIFFTSD